jgi:hypothetical protein
VAAANDRYSATELDELLLSPANKVSRLCFNTAKRAALLPNLAANEYRFETKPGQQTRSCFHLFQVICPFFFQIKAV